MSQFEWAVIPDGAHRVLDHGFVSLLWMAGDGDHEIVEDARVSHHLGRKGDVADQKLIRYMMRNNHGTPFEGVVFKFLIRCPIFVARQWFRHRMASYSETSGRYVKLPNLVFVPAQMRIPGSSNKQGSVIPETMRDVAPHIDSDYQYTGESEPEMLRTLAFISNVLGTDDPVSVWNDTMRKRMEKHLNRCLYEYDYLIAHGVALEQARLVLPMAIYTEFRWTVNLRSLMHFIALRCAGNAQSEIRDYADILLTIMRGALPWTADAFEQYILGRGENGRETASGSAARGV